MVTRKPVNPTHVPAPLHQAANNPPYPTESIMPSEATNGNGGHVGHGTAVQQEEPAWGEETRSRSSSVSSTDTWNSGTTAEEEDVPGDELPEPLKPGKKQEQENELPAALRVGPPDGFARRSQESQRQELTGDQEAWAGVEQQNGTQHISPQPTNPYIRMQRTGQQPSYGGETSQSVWGNVPGPHPPPAAAPPPPPVELPTIRTPTEEMQGFSISDATEGKPAIAMEDPWRPNSAQQAPYEPVQSVSSHPTGSGNPWQTDLDRETGKNETTTVPPVAPQVRNFEPQPSLLDEDLVPQLPPRPSEEYAPPQPPRPAPIDVSQVDRRASEPETPMTKARRQRNEHYQIKHVNWADMSRGSHEMRRSPILTQNANGPCPLLALVNALVLSTPQGMNTALFETLKSREQVSLGLLLDAVFEELARRSESTGKDLPDVGDLYSFLISLHTGMNVNPRLVASSSQPSGSLDTGAAGPEAKPGAFEETREMRLYSTFDVPLIHGWIPPVGSAAYAAFERSAQTFEDAQNIQFRKEELEDKLRAQGLTAQEQQTLEDVASIKSFLNSYPTQLTDYGLDVMKKSLKPGQIAILFRNDHFATLYKEPRSGTLLTLVTDAGYSTHDEIVWESLVDVNGAASELFSGDFRPVGNTNSGGLSGQTSGSTGNVTDQPDYSQFEGGWQTVQPRNNRGNRNARNNNSSGGTSFHTPAEAVNIPRESAEGQFSPPPELGRTTSEQEDHDLALALQLQEEEEERERRETAARREREEDLSRRMLEREQTEQPPAIPPRRSQNATTPAYAPPSGDPNAPPPSYEQAASDRPYRPSGAPTSPRPGNPLHTLNALEHQQQQQQQQAQSAYAAQSQTSLHATPPYHNRRRSSGFGSGGGRGRRQPSTGHIPQGSYGSPSPVQGSRVEEEKCIMM